MTAVAAAAASFVFRQALDIFSEMLGNDHEDVGSALNLLAVVVGEQGRYLEVYTMSMITKY